MKTYSRHRCTARHRIYSKFIECAIPRVAWVTGDGPYALIAWCGVPTVTLHPAVAAAEQTKAFIDKTGCGHRCQRHHEIVLVDCPSCLG